MSALRFNVFGRIVEVRREGGEWRTFAVGTDGKLGPAGFEIPAFIEDAELEQYLFDIFHESASRSGQDVRRLTS